jgi:dihydroorotate dehydrogenase electron transfer subunit
MAVFRQRPDPDAAGSARVEILYKTEGRGTRLLADAQLGDRLNVVGPLGRAFPPIRSGTTAVLVGGGTGVASLYELARSAEAGARVRVLLGARGVGDLMGRAEYEALEGVEVAVATEDGSLGLEGRVTALLEPLLGRDGDVVPGGDIVVYACGPTPMMAACARLCAGAAVRCWVSLENNMACGYGVCLGCAAPKRSEGYALVCRAGPVFDASEVGWEAMP